MKSNLMNFFNKTKTFLKSLFSGQSLIIILSILGVSILIFIIWAVNSYSGSIECDRPATAVSPAGTFYYEYDIKGLTIVKLNDVEVNESMVRDYEKRVGTGFSLIPNYNLNKILAYEPTSTCK